MTELPKRPVIIERFYETLEDKTNAELTPAQKQAIEQAIISVTLAARHRVDVRKSFPFFGKRYYLVILLGRDLRRHVRRESLLSHWVVTLFVLMAALFCLSSVLLVLYMIKSALGIDLFPDSHLGIWDWWLGLWQR